MRFLIPFLGVLLLTSAACDTGTPSNTNIGANNSISNATQNIDPKDLPPGLSASPSQPVNNANAINASTESGTSTPAIPDPKTLGKPTKPGASPTPGIPDEATIRKQMEQMRRAMNSNVNQPPPPPPGAGDGQMMRKKPRMTNTNN